MHTTIMKSKYIALSIITILVFGRIYYAFAQNTVTNISITFAKNSFTQRNFTWNTKDAKISELKLTKDDGTTKTYKSITTQVNAFIEYDSNANTFYKQSNKTNFYSHKLTISNLESGHTYNYKIGNEKGSFKVNNNDENFSFIYMTDPQGYSTGDFNSWGKVTNLIAGKFSKSSFVTISGDLVDRGSSERLWNDFFDNGKTIFSNYVVAPAIGNHETDYFENTFSEHFNFPKNNIASLPNYVYSFDYNNAHFAVLSTEMSYGQLNSKDATINKKANDLLNNQIIWLKEDVVKSNKKWNFVILHKGLNPSGGYVGDGTVKVLKDKLTPVFDELSIDVVLQGHDHTFTKAYWYKNENVQNVTATPVEITKTNSKKGTLYIIGNSVGKKYYDISKKFDGSYHAYQPYKPTFSNISVTKNKIAIDSYFVTGDNLNYFDSVTISK